MGGLLNFKIIVITIIIVIITALSIVFFLVQPKKTISPISSKPLENKAIEVLEKQPSKTLKNYTDDAGFSFNYPEDVQVGKKEVKDESIYADLILFSSQTKGSISIKISDTKFKSLDDWFLENKTTTTGAIKKDIKIGELKGLETKVDNKQLAAALNQDILFAFTVDASTPSNQRYWLSVYDIILSGFSFVPQESSSVSSNSSPDVSSDEVILEEESIE